MARHSFIQISKLPNLKGRIDYIANPKRQENLYATYNTTDDALWGKLIIALPETYCDFNKQTMLEAFTNYFHSEYGVHCIAAMHHNKTKTNLHIYLIFSEREELKDGIEKIATRNMFYHEFGKHVRTKKEILDADGNIRKGCSIIKKGEVYENNRFSKKKPEFKSRSFLSEVKEKYTEKMNLLLSDDEKLKVFKNEGLYLLTKKIGKNNPKAEEIAEANEARKEWNSVVDEVLFYKVPAKHTLSGTEYYDYKTFIGSAERLFLAAIDLAIDVLKGLIESIRQSLNQKVDMMKRLIRNTKRFMLWCLIWRQEKVADRNTEP